MTTQETVAVVKPPLHEHLELCLSHLHHFPTHLVKVLPVFDGAERFERGAGSETFQGLELAGDLDLTSIEQKLQQLLHPNNQPAKLSGFQSVLLARRRRMLEKLGIIVNGIDDDDGELKVPIVPFVEPAYGPESCCVVVPYKLPEWTAHWLSWCDEPDGLRPEAMIEAIRFGIDLLNHALPGILTDLETHARAFLDNEASRVSVAA